MLTHKRLFALAKDGSFVLNTFRKQSRPRSSMDRTALS